MVHLDPNSSNEKSEELQEIINKYKKILLAKNDFFITISHELRTPLHIISGFMNIIMHTQPKDEHYEYLDKIQSSADRIGEILSDILDYSKLETKAIILEKNEFNLKQTLQDVVRIFEEKASKKNLNIQLSMASDVVVNVISDAGRFRQAMMTLIDNAVKFTSEGEILVEASVVEDDFQVQKVKITIQDSGIGMSEEELKVIFDPYYQLNSSLTRNYYGLGIGLSVCREIVALMEGEIQVESKVGEGSKFGLILPFEKSKRQLRIYDTLNGQVQGKRILLIEDNPVIQKIVSKIIRTWGAEIDVVSSAEEGLVYVFNSYKQKKCYDIAIVDYLLDKMNGLEFGRKIQEDKMVNDLPLIFFTAMGVRGDALVARQAGYDAYLTKPLDPNILYECVVELTQNGKRKPNDEMLTKYMLSKKHIRTYILIVDAISEEVSQSKMLIESLGFECHIADREATVLEYIQKYDFNLIFMELDLKDTNGFDLTEKIRNSEGNYKDIPIISLTENEKLKNRCLKVGMNDFLTKPLQADLLYEVLRKWGGYSLYSRKPKAGLTRRDSDINM